MATIIIPVTSGVRKGLTGNAISASPVGTKFTLSESINNFKWMLIYTGRNNQNNGGIMYFIAPAGASTIRVMAPTSLDNSDYYILQKNSDTEYEVVASSSTGGAYGVREIQGIY